MIYVVIMPGWAWVALILAIWATFAYQTYNRIGFGHNIIMGLFVALTIQSVAASSTAIATSQNPISEFACLMGIFGTLLYPIILLAEVAVLIFVSRTWLPSHRNRKRRFAAWLSLWFILNLVAFLAHVRSAVLCTV